MQMPTAAKCMSKKSGLHFKVWWVLQSVFTSTVYSKVCCHCPAPLSYWPFTPDSSSSFSQHFSPHLSKVSYPCLHFPYKQQLHIRLVFPCPELLKHSTIRTPSPPFRQQSILPLISDLTPFLANSAFSFTVLPWDDLSATESSIQRTCPSISCCNNSPQPLSAATASKVVQSRFNPRIPVFRDRRHFTKYM